MVQKLSIIQQDADDVYVLFDVVSIYTNIPVYLALKCLTEKWEDIKHHTSLSKSLFLEVVSLCLKNSYLCYNNTFYSQITGLAMGSPLSAIVSEIR